MKGPSGAHVRGGAPREGWANPAEPELAAERLQVMAVHVPGCGRSLRVPQASDRTYWENPGRAAAPLVPEAGRSRRTNAGENCQERRVKRGNEPDSTQTG